MPEAFTDPNLDLTQADVGDEIAVDNRTHAEAGGGAYCKSIGSWLHTSLIAN